MMIDSLEMTDGRSRGRSSTHCRSRRRTRIVITHGTDTMIETARALAEGLAAIGDKTIVLTGAMVPYAFGSSDGLFNLGSALVVRPGAPGGRLRGDERALLRMEPGTEEP